MTIDEAFKISHGFNGDVAIVTPIDDYEWVFEHPEIKKLPLRGHQGSFAISNARLGYMFYLYLKENSSGYCVYGARDKSYHYKPIGVKYLEVEREDLMVQYLKIIK